MCAGCWWKLPGTIAAPTGPQWHCGARDQAPAAARARAHADNQRLHARWVDLNLRRKRAVIANVAVARELAGWCWSLAVLPD
ncbi:transposase IS116/IS110/IS902 family domain protein [Mycobacterium kansasii 662]|uniref:Transposase n=2 Tax=Mycobacterium kansasii TaxID=1768 RepID=U5WN08_MYCKA|nr:transposase [Mycobacterium kansasii ATCC 12478]EUA18953.1 transposase IS116/IS110/IS902 family domain protein [Mycobacterium kansasii 662]KEP41119.1 transposase [Mycobacterium kansasii]